MHRPVPVWENGRETGVVDAAIAAEQGYVLLDLGDEWVPYLFTERGNESETPIPHDYRPIYLALANERPAPGHHGERAAKDKYLELYGILPTLGVLRRRMAETAARECLTALDPTPLDSFEGFASHRDNETARRIARNFDVLDRRMRRIAERAGLTDPTALDPESLDERERRRLAEWREQAPLVAAIRAAQERLACEGFYAGKGRWVRGALDWPTREALAEFERRHRIYGWGFLGGETLAALRRPALENERLAVLRVLVERAMLSMGVIEDGSTSTRADGTPRTFRGADGREHPIPNLEAELRERIVAAFGLQSPESTRAWLDGLGDLGGERLVAFRGPRLPEYYAADMDLYVEIDRGDVWYDFPYDEAGREVPQPVSRRPRLTVHAVYLGQRIPLARMGTTIGGWRSEMVNGVSMWRYKNSPVGEVVWHQVVSAPVWLPPETTPPRDLLVRVPRRTGAEAWRVNYHETGPSYASAYGLVAAYHVRFSRTPDGGYRYWGDEGIRTHGSVDYMSIMRRHSHGCHRLHNHMAVRLMTFVLAHREHRRIGHDRLAFRLPLEHEGHNYLVEINRGGYVFELAEPVHVRVLEGRIQGSTRRPIEHPLPKFDTTRGAYIMRDPATGAETAVRIARDGTMTPIPMPAPPGPLPAGPTQPTAPTTPVAASPLAAASP
ncbi:MAG: peptidoglycan-binding domain-containing protein [Myxococcales bacterium]|nr:peptidoglycan-binding domain-containing protein [Myxococcales bacterium]